MARRPIAIPEEDRVRIAWLYHVEGLTQSQIAKRYGLSRVKVQRILADCQAEGVVQITISSPIAACVELEAQLCAVFRLQEAIVVPTPVHPDPLYRVIGRAAGALLARRLRSGAIVGVGWGRTLVEATRGLLWRPMSHLRIVSLLGGLTQSSAINPYEIAWRVADFYGATCYYLPAPAFGDDEEVTERFYRMESVRRVLELAERAELALVSVGDVTEHSTIAQMGLLTLDELAEIRQAGAVGDILGRYYDVQGILLDHPVNRRAIALSLEALRRIPTVILASGGPAKVEAIVGALRGRFCTVLVTDEQTARGVLEIAVERPVEAMR
jgi:DNA-binding transcriptional regulator LsrR (DeoR family)